MFIKKKKVTKSFNPFGRWHLYYSLSPLVIYDEISGGISTIFHCRYTVNALFQLSRTIRKIYWNSTGKSLGNPQWRPGPYHATIPPPENHDNTNSPIKTTQFVVKKVKNAEEVKVGHLLNVNFRQ